MTQAITISRTEAGWTVAIDNPFERHETTKVMSTEHDNTFTRRSIALSAVTIAKGIEAPVYVEGGDDENLSMSMHVSKAMAILGYDPSKF